MHEVMKNERISQTRMGPSILTYNLKLAENKQNSSFRKKVPIIRIKKRIIPPSI